MLRSLSGVRKAVALVLTAILSSGGAAVAAPRDGGFRAPSQSPAPIHEAASRAPLLAVALAGQRLVAVGHRGVIVYSDDSGRSWKQAQVPVETDLVAVAFSSPRTGWAVGHMGVVLQSEDAGASWSRRFADSQIGHLVRKHYAAQRLNGDSSAARIADAASRSLKENSFPSLLDVWFESPTHGTIIGSFNTMLRTEDGGVTWTPWMDRVENPEDLHLYALRGTPGGVYLAGERGMVWRLDESSKRWVAMPTGYTGSLFGLVTNGSKVIVFGMRGTVYTTEDSGQSWRSLRTPSKAGLTAGLTLRSGHIMLADQAGGLLRSTDGGRSFSTVGSKVNSPAFSLAQAADGRVISAGPRGILALPIH